MIQKENVKYYAPVVFFLLLLIDGQISKILGTWTENSYFANSHLLLLAFLVAVPLLSKRYLLITSLILGILADSYYIGIIGIYAVALPATVMLMFTFANLTNTNPFTAFFGNIIFVTAYELIVILIQIIFQLSNVRPVIFVTSVLGPTFLLNMIFFVIFIFPIKKLFAVK